MKTYPQEFILSKHWIKKYLLISTLIGLFIGATVNAAAVQVLSFGVAVLFSLTFFLRKRHINIYYATGILFCILLTQYLIFAGSSDINAIVLVALLLYYLVFFMFFIDFSAFMTRIKDSQNAESENLFFITFILIFLFAFFGDYQQNTWRFAGPFENVLNFTGFISVLFSFYIITFGITKKSIIISIFIAIFAFLSISPHQRASRLVLEAYKDSNMVG